MIYGFWKLLPVDVWRRESLNTWPRCSQGILSHRHFLVISFIFPSRGCWSSASARKSSWVPHHLDNLTTMGPYWWDSTTPTNSRLLISGGHSLPWYIHRFFMLLRMPLLLNGELYCLWFECLGFSLLEILLYSSIIIPYAQCQIA